MVLGIGERRLIEILCGDMRCVEYRDDCALVPLDGDYLVLTTDMVHRSTDFPRGMSWWQMGWMSAAVSFSDVAAMGARPIGVLMAMGLPGDMSLEAAREIARGIGDCAEHCDARVLGGDTDGHDELTLVSTAVGRVGKDQVLRRFGASVGDLIAVTGTLGDAAAGLRINDPDDPLTQRLFEPIPRVWEAQRLGESGVVSSMMDISDGLALSLHDLQDASGLGYHVYLDRLPIRQNVKEIARDQEDLIALVVATGGEFELLFTLHPDDERLAKEACEFTVIGEVVEDGVWLTVDGEKRKLGPRGYQH